MCSLTYWPKLSWKAGLESAFLFASEHPPNSQPADSLERFVHIHKTIDKTGTQQGWEVFSILRCLGLCHIEGLELVFMGEK